MAIVSILMDCHRQKKFCLPAASRFFDFHTFANFKKNDFGQFLKVAQTTSNANLAPEMHLYGTKSRGKSPNFMPKDPEMCFFGSFFWSKSKHFTRGRYPKSRDPRRLTKIYVCGLNFSLYFLWRDFHLFFSSPFTAYLYKRVF